MSQMLMLFCAVFPRCLLKSLDLIRYCYLKRKNSIHIHIIFDAQYIYCTSIHSGEIATCIQWDFIPARTAENSTPLKYHCPKITKSYR